MAERETFTVEVGAGELMYPDIYEPHSFENGGRPRFSVLLPFANLPNVFTSDIKKVGPYKGTVMARVSSYYRPEVKPINVIGRKDDAVDILVHDLARLDACNIPSDKIFLNYKTELELSRCNYLHKTTDHMTQSGSLLVLHSITLYL